MKSLLLIFSAALFISCSQAAFIPCINPAAESAAPAMRMMPISMGNKWKYAQKEIDKDKKETLVGIRILEIGASKTVFYRDEKGKKQDIQVYTLLVDGNVSNHIFYVNCGEGAIYATSYSAIETELIAGRSIPDNPVNMQADFRDKKYVWKQEGAVKTPAGTFDSWSSTFSTPEGTTKEYYAKGVGLVKSEQYNSRGRRTALMELLEYKVKE